MQVELLEVISDPYNGLEEGVDFWVDESGYIQVSTTLIAGKILSRVNASGQFEKKLVKLAVKGDSIILGFDTLLDVEPAYVTKIGYKSSTEVAIKSDGKKFYVYLNSKRSNRAFTTLGKARSFVRKLDKELKSETEEPENFDD
jgi:hypothetical protein